MKSGYGKLVLALKPGEKQKAVEEGNFVNGRITDGHVKICNPDGDSYEGDYRNGTRHGKGRYNYADGGYYDGQWQDGNCVGRGKRVWP